MSLRENLPGDKAIGKPEQAPNHDSAQFASVGFFSCSKQKRKFEVRVSLHKANQSIFSFSSTPFKIFMRVGGDYSLFNMSF